MGASSPVTLADPKHQIDIGPQPKHSVEKLPQRCIKMRFIADAAFVHGPHSLVEIDADPTQFLIRAPQMVGFDRSDRQRKTGLIAEQQPDDIACGAVLSAQRGKRLALLQLHTNPDHLASHRFLSIAMGTGGATERHMARTSALPEAGVVEFVPQT
jgi:hypothetical protein